MNFKEWLKSLEPERKVTPGEDLADSIGLMVICALVCFMIFL
jgi:hypothetical protein